MNPILAEETQQSIMRLQGAVKIVTKGCYDPDSAFLQFAQKMNECGFSCFIQVQREQLFQLIQHPHETGLVRQITGKIAGQGCECVRWGDRGALF